MTQTGVASPPLWDVRAPSSTDILGIPVCRGGLVVDFDEDEALARFEQPQVDIVCDLGAGECQSTIWTCDLTHGYISINADYRS